VAIKAWEHWTSSFVGVEPPLLVEDPHNLNLASDTGVIASKFFKLAEERRFWLTIATAAA